MEEYFLVVVWLLTHEIENSQIISGGGSFMWQNCYLCIENVRKITQIKNNALKNVYPFNRNRDYPGVE